MNNTVSSNRHSGPARVSAPEPESPNHFISIGLCQPDHGYHGFNNASYLNRQINLHYVTFAFGPRPFVSPPKFIRPPPGAAE
jgi:hypothetical protein